MTDNSETLPATSQSQQQLETSRCNNDNGMIEDAQGGEADGTGDNKMLLVSFGFAFVAIAYMIYSKQRENNKILTEMYEKSD